MCYETHKHSLILHQFQIYALLLFFHLICVCVIIRKTVFFRYLYHLNFETENHTLNCFSGILFTTFQIFFEGDFSMRGWKWKLGSSSNFVLFSTLKTFNDCLWGLMFFLAGCHIDFKMFPKILLSC